MSGRRSMIPIVGGVTGFLGGVASIVNTVMQYEKDSAGKHLSGEQFIKNSLRQKMGTVIPVYLGANPSIPNKALYAQLERAVSQTKLRSLTVSYGPEGIGKSTYVRDFAIKHIIGGGHAVVLTSINSILELKNLLSIPTNSEISDYMPTNSIIILDQQENIQLSEVSDIMYRALALEARRTGKFHVIVCVSDPIAAKRLLNLNGGDKINSVCPSTELKVGNDEIDMFIASRLATLSPSEREELRVLTYHTRTLGILVDAADTLDDSGHTLGRRKLDILKARADGIVKSWEEFAAIDENPYKK